MLCEKSWLKLDPLASEYSCCASAVVQESTETLPHRTVDREDDLPAAVKEQLKVMRGPEWQNQSLIVIGPVYPKSLPRDFVANEFSYGVARLTRSGQLTESSPAVVALKKALESVARSGSGGDAVDQLRSVPQTGSESEFINAVVLSLR